MGYQHQCAREIRKTLFEHFQGWNIQIVGRLIENQQVRWLKHQIGNQNARLLAAGKVRTGMSSCSDRKRNCLAHAVICIELPR